ncbi:hypothetical protein [Paracidovorax valerianellae]|uniref:Uncharacterized protein n=1 Tax=Paracidovorax valerianellae TaxID=187868 RepID=A0A1G7DNY9_9BURK|nr:hypothetical protein [Paracidovorax valerianellae]MDA8446683.1 hypothetical protein [Paracidovorax valerianellae]SDE53218.1 hypothetical protein SAMN05192589_1209 [Paracidovorax valerianellae]
MKDSEEEPGRSIQHAIPPGVTDAFEIRPPSVPKSANAIIDEQMGGCIGYVHEGARGVWNIYNGMGDQVAIEELPLEASPIDPLDVLILGGIVFKIGRWGWLARKNGSAVAAVTSAGTAVMQRFVKLLRTKLLAPQARQIKFTETAARHMAEPGRYVPIHILAAAIRFGTRKIDPQGAKGLFMYRIEMMKLRKTKVMINGRAEIRYIPQKYNLEVVVRESDWTVMHFLYK